MYSFMLLLVTITGYVMTLPDVSNWLQTKLIFCNELWDSFGNTKTQHDNICKAITGYLAVYRLMFATFIFFLVFGFIMIKVRSSRDPRVMLHNGY